MAANKINGREYEFADVGCIINGKSALGITDLEYTKEADHTNINAKGRDPHSMGRGKNKYEAKISMLESEFRALNSSLGPGKDITDAKPFTVTVSYGDGVESPLTVDELVKVRVRKFTKKHNRDLDAMVVEMDCLPFKINYNITGTAIAS